MRMSNITKGIIKEGKISINDLLVDDIIPNNYIGKGECDILLVETENEGTKELIPIQTDANKFLNDLVDELVKCFDAAFIGAIDPQLGVDVTTQFTKAKGILEKYKELLP